MRPVGVGPPPVARTLPLVARYTWARQWRSAVLEGFAAGVIGLAAFVVKRSLGAPEHWVPVLIALWQIVWVFAPGIGTLLARADPQKLWRVLAFAAYLPLAAVALVGIERAGEHGRGEGNLALFLVLMALHYATSIALVPHRGALLRTNYPAHVRGRMYGLLLVANLLAAAAAAKAAGYLLDCDPRWVRAIFPAAAASGIVAFLLMGRIRWRRARGARRLAGARESPREAVANAWRETFRILREDRAFRTYERGFMLYGLGFLASVGLLVLYAEGELGLSYDAWTTAQSVAFPLAQIAGAALFGRLADRLGVVRTTAASFLLLSCFFGAMPLVGSAGALAAACVLWGVAMGGVNIGWSLGPLHFAPEGRAHMYGAVHFCLVGVRSLVGPFLGFAAKELLSYPAAFALSAALVLSGAFTVWRLGPSRGAVS